MAPGRLDARAGRAAYDAVVAAAQLALDGRVDAIATAPLHKEAMHRAGYPYPGHTELLAELCGVRDFAMMLYLGPDESLRSPGGLAVVHVTLHTALRNVFGELSEEAVLAKARLADRFLDPADRRAAADRRLRAQSARRRGGAVRRRGADDHRPAVEPRSGRRAAAGRAVCRPTP